MIHGEDLELRKAYYADLIGYKSIRMYEDKDGVFAGIIEGVDERGRLQIFKEKQLLHFDMQEVKFLF